MRRGRCLRAGVLLLLAEAVWAGDVPSYYGNVEAVPSVSPARSPVRSSSGAPGVDGRRFDMDGLPRPLSTVRPGSAMADHPASSVTGVPPALPPRMERGVQDVEVGMDGLARYTGAVAGQVQQHGLRGFLAMPPELKAQGAAVGAKLGDGIRGIAADTAVEMTSPTR